MINASPIVPNIARRFCTPLARVVLALAVLAAAVWLVYSPALNRIFHSDQLVYLTDMEGSTSIFKHYDYNLSRRYFKGDEFLYRPLLFILLATEHRLFDYNYRDWNLANLCFHFLVATLLYGVLRKIQPTYFALLFALLFAVMRPHHGLVTWNHLGGYLLAFGFALLSWLAGQRLLLPVAKSVWCWVIYLSSAMVSLLFYECAFAFYVAYSAYLLTSFILYYHRLPTRAALLLALPLLAFGGLYFFHYQNARALTRFYQDDSTASSVFGFAHLHLLPSMLMNRVLYWSTIALVPGKLVHHAFFSGEVFEGIDPLARPLLNGLTVSLLAVAAIAFIGATGRNYIRQRLPLIAAVLLALLGYSSIIVLGRTSERSWYPYGFCLGAVLLIYTCLDFAGLTRLKRWLATAALLGIIAVHASLSYGLSKEIHQANAIVSGCYDQTAAFIEQHRTEPDFSFAVEFPPRLDAPISLREGFGGNDQSNDPVRVMKKSQIVFYRYYNADRPKYVLRWSQRASEVPCASWPFLVIRSSARGMEANHSAP